MKIAFAIDGNCVAQHFGRCEQYTLVSIDEGKEIGRETILSPEHQPGMLPLFLSAFGITHIAAGGMGPKAQDLFSENNIQVIVGVSGPLEQVIETLLQGSLKVGESLCQHGPDHVCDHE